VIEPVFLPAGRRVGRPLSLWPQVSPHVFHSVSVTDSGTGHHRQAIAGPA
jgi:hypothetical protein